MWPHPLKTTPRRGMDSEHWEVLAVFLFLRVFLSHLRDHWCDVVHYEILLLLIKNIYTVLTPSKLSSEWLNPLFWTQCNDQVCVTWGPIEYLITYSHKRKYICRETCLNLGVIRASGIWGFCRTLHFLHPWLSDGPAHLSQQAIYRRRCTAE